MSPRIHINSGGIIATTLSGNAEDTIAPAIMSTTDQVDEFLLIDTGITDSTADVVKELVGDRLTIKKFRWRDDFSAARNFALRTATEMGFDWCMTLDTDERMVFDTGFDLRSHLAKAKTPLFLVRQVDGTYAKERIFRLPTSLRFRGYTHEGLKGPNTRGELLDGARFWELPKTPEQIQAKNERDVRLLTEYLETEDEPRWWFHLGTSYHGLKKYEEAIYAYIKCVQFRGWDEEASWACYMAGECYCLLDRYEDAEGICKLGMMIRPATMELAWLASYAAYKQKAFDRAIELAKHALSLPADPNRIGFRNPQAVENAWEILYYAHHALGHQAEAAEAHHEFTTRRQYRLGGTGPGGESP